MSSPDDAAYSESLFQTGWFVESLLTQTLIIHIIRTNKIPFLQSQPSWPLMMMSLIIMTCGIAIPFTHLGTYLGFTPLPLLYWPLLAITLLSYVVLTQLVKCGCSADNGYKIDHSRFPKSYCYPEGNDHDSQAFRDLFGSGDSPRQ